MSPPRYLVTAGNTREKIDSVRDWGNIFTGNTGFTIAQALSQIGEVDLLTSNRSHLQQIVSPKIQGYEFSSHEDLLHALENRMKLTKYAGIFMTAAVADYAPAGVYEIISQEKSATPGEQHWIVRDVQTAKIKSTHQAIAVLGKPTQKIIDMFREPWGHKGLLVKFKLEVGISSEELIAIGQRSRAASGADYLVANTLDMINGERAGAFLISAKDHQWISRADLPRVLTEIARSAV
jgi:phosphopantothenoylcysteine synthetase/decarboxylase